MAVALAGLRLPAQKGTGLPFGSPASTTIDLGAIRYVWLCDGMTQKKTLSASVSPFALSGVSIPAPVFLRCRRNIPHDNARAQLCVFLCFSFLLLGLLAGVGHCFSFHFIQLPGDHFFSESDKPVIATASDVLDLKVEIANGHFDTPSASKECRLSREWRTTSDGKRQ